MYQPPIARRSDSSRDSETMRSCVSASPSALARVLFEPELLKCLGLTGQDDVVDVTRDLDRVVELADLGHVHPHPGPAQVLTHAIETQFDDLADAAPAAHLD